MFDVSSVLVLAVLIGFGAAETPLQAARGQSMSCDAAYAQAERAYLRADFEKSLSLLVVCTNDRPKSEVKLRVYRLQAFAHLGMGDDAAARRAVEDLLDVYPAYTPNPSDDRPDYADLVAGVRASRREPSEPDTAARDRRWVRWVVASAAAIATTVVVAVLIRDGGQDNDDDPDPPDNDIDDDLD
jgi:hypothetical protein